jgi:hypothetical protein
LSEHWEVAPRSIRLAVIGVCSTLGLLITGAAGIAVYSISNDGLKATWASATCSSGAGCEVYRGEARCMSRLDKIAYTKEIYIWSRSVAEARPVIAAHAPQCTLGDVAWYGKNSPTGRLRHRNQ